MADDDSGVDLSNFYSCSLKTGDMSFPSAEHMYQWLKAAYNVPPPARSCQYNIATKRICSLNNYVSGGYAAFCLAMSTLITTSVASNKKGVGIMFSNQYHCTDEYTFNNVHWWYDWRQTPNDEHRLNKCSYSVRSGYVPMVNGKHFERGINISVKSQYLLGFNEPDHKVQANLTAAQAAIMWKEVEKNGVGKVLVSPAVTNIHWLEQFFHECHNCRVDHVAIHIYDWNCNVHRVMSKLKQAWDRFHKPIWLTEFACPRTTSANEQLRFMREILPLLEAAPYVFRYAWFASRWMVQGDYVDKSASLLKPYSADLTPLGHYYNNFIH